MSIYKWPCLLMVFLLSACITTPNASIRFSIDASKYLNPDLSLASLPVRIKIYQLSDATLFHEATFRQLWKSDVAVLGKTLLAKKELTINPGEKESIKMARHPQAEYVAVVGVFRRHEGSTWKDLKPLPGQVNSLIKPLAIEANQHKVEIR